MPRHPCCRRVGIPAQALAFGPVGLAKPGGDEVVMTLDELEAIRLADHLDLYQEEAAVKMDVSRATLGRILRSARRKVADVLTHGLTLRIEGGSVRCVDRRRSACHCGRRRGAPIHGRGAHKGAPEERTK